MKKILFLAVIFLEIVGIFSLYNITLITNASAGPAPQGGKAKCFQEGNGCDVTTEAISGKQNHNCCTQDESGKGISLTCDTSKKAPPHDGTCVSTEEDDDPANDTPACIGKNEDKECTPYKNRSTGEDTKGPPDDIGKSCCDGICSSKTKRCETPKNSCTRKTDQSCTPLRQMGMGHDTRGAPGNCCVEGVCNSDTSKCEANQCIDDTKTECTPPAKGLGTSSVDPDKACCAGKICDEKTKRCKANPKEVTCMGEDADCEKGGTKCCGEMTCFIQANDKGKCMEGLPNPPSPPCSKFDDKGKCSTVMTAFGDMNTDPEAFIKSLFSILLSLSGGIAMLLIMKSGYLIMTSQGKPEAIQAGRDQLTAAIVGLIFLIFSFVILQTIGVDLLHINIDKAK